LLCEFEFSGFFFSGYVDEDLDGVDEEGEIIEFFFCFLFFLNEINEKKRK